MLADPEQWQKLPAQVAQWLTLQAEVSRVPNESGLLVETFARAARYYMTCYPFEGRLAHQTLGMLLTRRLSAPVRARWGLSPMITRCRYGACAMWG